MFTANRICITLLALIFLPFSVSANNLGIAQQFNGFFLESFNAVNSRVEGRLAVGGSINIDNYSVADQLTTENAGLVLLAGEDINYLNGRIYYGNAIAEGSVEGVSYRVLNSLAAEQSVEGEQLLPFNFQDEFIKLKDVSLRLAQSPANGTVEYKWGGTHLTGDCQSPLQIFNLDGAQLLASYSFNLTCIPNDATIIFNIDGDIAGLGSLSLNSLISHRTKTIFNFYQATSLSFLWVQVEGSVLAPYAEIDNPNGAINGTVIAKSWNGTMHLINLPFIGDLSFLNKPPQIISPPVFYVDEKIDYDYQVEVLEPSPQLTYSLDLAPEAMTIDSTSGEIDWIADASYVASTATFNTQCYIVPEGAIEIVQEGEEAKSGRNYIAPLFLRVKEAITNASNYTGPAAIAWDETNKCLGCHIQTQSLVGLATSQDKAEVDQDAINYLLNELITSQQSDGTIRQSHPEYSITQTVMALWSLSDGLNPDVTFPIRARALDYLWTRKQGTTQAYWIQDHNTGWMNTNTATSAMVALAASRYLSDASTQTVTITQQQTIDNWQSIVPQMAEYFLASSQNVNDGSLINSFRLIGLAELLPHIQDTELQTRIETALQVIDDELRNKQLPTGGWSYAISGTVSDPLISAWVGIAINYLHPALTDAVVLNNITYLLDSQAANGTWSTPSGLYTTPLGTTSLIMSYLPVALEHLGNPDLRVSDIILTEQEQQPHYLAATITNRGLGDITTPIVVEFYNDKNALLGTANVSEMRSGLNQVASIEVNETDLTKDVFVRITVSKDVEECQITNNEVKAAIVKARVSDPFGNFDTQIFSVNVNDVNEAPVITSEPTIEHQQGQEYLYQVQTSDTDLGDAAKFELIDPPIGLYVDERTGQIFSNAAQLLPGDYSITVQVSDLAGLTTTQTFELIVKENQAPTITSNAIESGLEKSGYEYQVTATDPNPNDTLSYGLEIANSGMSINKETGFLSWQASSGFVEPLISDNGLCEAQPNTITDFQVVEKWHWTKSNGSATHVYGPSLVAQLSDDNNDGLINSDDNTDILFFTNDGVLRAVDGDTGVENLSVSLGFSYLSSPAIADVDGDGHPEIVVVGTNRQKLFLLENDGTKIWEAAIPNISKSRPRDGISIADLDADGHPEIILGNLVYSNTGELLWKGQYDTGGETTYGIVSAVEDIDLDGFYEVIAGRTVYRHDGSVYWHRSNLSGASSGFNAVANFDQDDEAEIVLVANSKLYLLDTDGSTIWGPVSLPGGGFGGAPTVADVDNDGIPEIAVAGANYYSLFNHKGEVLWSRKTVDASSNRTGSSFFDFEGDGKSEILYADEYVFYIFDGETGSIIYQRENRSGTVLEYPVVADVDNDGHAEIVLGENTDSTSGLRVLEGAPEWVATRRIWNQYSYSINNINDDLTVPSTPTYPWLTHNTFRLNTFLDRPALAQADLIVHSIRYDAAASLITATVKNRGLKTSEATSVNFFHEHFWTQESALGTIDVTAINAGQEIEITLSVDDEIIIETIRSEINSDKSVIECSYDNNISKAAIAEVRVYDEAKLWDKQKFAISITNQNDAPAITSLKTSQGSEGSHYKFQVEVTDADLGDAFTYQLSSEVENFSINEKTGEISASDLVQGTYLLTILVNDLAGETAEQYHVVTVSEASNNPPYFITHPDLQVNVGEEYTYQAGAEDPEDDLLSYILAQAPLTMQIDSVTGLLTWVPDTTEVGNTWVSITALDESGASETQSFIIEVIDPYADNIAPAIVSAPTGAIYEGKLFSYQIIAEDDQPLSELTFTLENQIAGMSLSESGLFTWLPTSVQAGQTFNIAVYVNDAQNASASQSLNLPVNHSANNPPVITSQPSLSAIQETAYEYQVKAEDQDGDAWTTTLLEGPNGLTLTANTLNWVPSSQQTGSQHTVKIQVEDARGAISTQSFTIWVSTPAIDNDAPTVLSSPTSPAVVGSIYQYQMLVSDPENDPITYQLNQVITGMSLNEQGLLTWTPNTEQIGDNSIVIALTDGANNLTHSFTLLAVAANDPSNPNSYPEIHSLPSTQASTLSSYSYQVDASDADGDALTYSLTKAPEGMSIDATGLVTWQATAEQIMMHAIKVSVSDGQGSSVQSFNLTVSDQVIPLEVSIVFTPQVINQGESLTVTVHEQGGSGNTTITATLDGTPISLNANNQLAIDSAATGSHTVDVSVTKGSEVITESATFYVQDGSDTTPPVVSISAPESETSISAPTALIGSVIDSNLKDYKVLISPKDKQQWTEIATGTAQVNDAQLAEIDPTLLINGFYDVVVIATDINGAETQDGLTINVEGNLKVGNFSFTVTDLEVPLAGIPIQVTRTYDSRRRHEDLDFGFGWSIGYKEIKLEESRPLFKGWSLEKYTSGFFGTTVDWCVEPQGQAIVSVTLPNGHQERFAAEASPKCSAYIPTIDVKVSFKALDNAQSELTLKNAPLLRLNGSELINLSTFEEFDPSEYVLTTKEGYIYHINQQTGIDKVDDPYGNTVTYTDNGIFHSGGQSIEFVRNAKGHIEQVIDHNGNVRTYTYSEALDLEKAANFEDESTSYTYHDQHALKDIIDPLNRRLLTNHYDEAGRLYKQVDNDGVETLFAHDIDGRQSVITDRRGNSTTFYYDDRGNVLSQFDAYNNETAFEYWPNDEVKYERKYDQSGLVSEMYYEVDQTNRDITLINDNGNITRYDYQYNADGSKVETITDPELKVYVNHYDPAGNIYRIIFPAINGENKEAGSQINAKGRVDWTLNSEGEKTSFTYYSSGQNDGLKKTETDADNNVMTFTYDENGNIASESKQVTLAGTLTTLTSHYVYDQQKRLIKTTDVDGLSTETAYDLAGNVDYMVDKRGRKTDYTYNLYGKLTETLFPDGTSESNTYDLENNLSTATDRQKRTTTYEYDKLNRLTTTRFADGSSTEMEYDALGNVERQWDEKGNQTTMQYDGSGRLEYSQDAKGNKHSYHYDSNNNLKSETDKNAHTTTYSYNALGQRISTELADNKQLNQTFDTLGRKLTSEDQAGKITQYTYDKLGRLETVIQSLAGGDLVTRYAYDEAGNKLSQEDALGRVTSWTYTALGQVETRTLPEGMSESFTYDDLGNMKTHTDFNNKVTTYNYHASNDRLLRVDYEDGTFEAYDYYDAGQVKSITTPTGIVSYQYDLRDRLVQEVKANGDSLVYDYDAVGNRTEVTTIVNGESETTTYSYNSLNQLDKVTAPDSTETTYSYDNAGNQKTVTAANGFVTTYHYDAINRLDDMNIVDSTGVEVESYDYVLGDNGRRDQVIEGNGRVVDYGYDDLYRLTSETVTDSVNGDYTATYTYDDVGNRKTSIIDGVSTAYSYDDNDRLLQEGGSIYTYDDNGNTLTESIDSDLTTYTYDAQNKLIAVDKTVSGTTTNSSYTYNADGIRTAQTVDGVETKYIVDSNRDYAQVLVELDATDTVQVQYTYGADLISQDRAGSVNYYHYDGLGSTRVLSDNTGAVTDTYNYEAFGETLNSTGSSENNYLFTGEQYDAGLDQYYLRARYYDQGIGRFTQQDTWMGHNSDPITLHKYLYANADPVLYVDPTGHFGLMSFAISNNIRTTLSEIQVDVGFSILDSAVGGPDVGSPNAVAIGVAAIGGAGAFKLMKLLSRKFNKVCSLPNSFTENTLVSTEFGFKRIADIQIGEKVWSFNEETGEKSLQEVVHFIHGEGDKEIVDITLISGEVIQATSGHPFYVNNANGRWDWLDAGDITTQSILTNLNGDELQVASVDKYLKQLSVYNITVDNDHTYFVGEGEVLNHNAGKCNPKWDWNHVFNGSRGGGVHHSSSVGGNFVVGNKTKQVGGFYEAPVFRKTPSGLKPKKGGGTSTFFPDSMSQEQVKSIMLAAAMKSGFKSGTTVPVHTIWPGVPKNVYIKVREGKAGWIGHPIIK